MICHNCLKNCGCKSCIAQRNSSKISVSHVHGKICKSHNQCRHCCYIKFIVKCLRHYGNCCSQNSKCPVCQWKQNDKSKHNIGFYSKTLIRMQVQLLYEELGIGYLEAPWKFQ